MTPLDEYQNRLRDRKKLRDECWARIGKVGYARLGSVGLVIFCIWQAFTIHLFPGAITLLPVVLFVVLVLYHERLHRQWRRAKGAVAFYERGLDRLEDRWPGKGNSGSQFLKEGHLYATDLDILGKASLFELLCTMRTKSGEETLARWLCHPASRDEILKRQAAVEELRNRLDLREDFGLIGDEVRSEVHPEFMVAWANARSSLHSNAIRVALAGLVGILLLSAIYGYLTDLRIAPVTVLFVEALVGLSCRTRVKEVIDQVSEPAKELNILGLALKRMERESYTSARLRELQANLANRGLKPSENIAYFMKLVGYLHQRRNEFFAPIAATLMWGTQFAYAIEAWRLRHGPEIKSWLEHFGEFEALCALAGYAYEHPHDPFPEIVDAGPVIEGEEMRHPLIPERTCVPNSLEIGGELQLLLVSGSNMSGKSTLLRTVGINTVLALAGGPVRAKRMKLSVVAIGATLRVQDSLQAGVSRFYAEIQRLHDTMKLTEGELPVLFLLDEILHGTNSHDRAIGAEAVVRGLMERGAIGLVTTHDLALTRVAESLQPQAKNVHFQDQLLNGRMTFDYVLHPGVVQKSNALELMRAVGLKV